MTVPELDKKEFCGLGQSLCALVVVWSILIVVSFVWSFLEIHRSSHELATNVARAYLDKDRSFRLWAASHGGVYVAVSRETPRNSSLNNCPEHDIQTTAGKRLTLLAPACMIRQLQEDFSKAYGIKGHLVGVNGLRPEAAADTWETAALQKFARGAIEAQEFTQIHGEPYLRLMRPMRTACNGLECRVVHAARYLATSREGSVFRFP